MAIDNRNTRPLRKRIYLPVTGFNGYSIDLITAGSAAAASTDALSIKASPAVINKEESTARIALGGTTAVNNNIQMRGIGNGTPRLADVQALNMTGLIVASDSDGVEMCGMIPSDLDYTRTLGCRVVWASNAAAVGSRTLLFEAKYKKYTLGAAAAASNAGALAVAATALNTILVAQAPTGSVKTIERTARGIINANTFTKLDYFWSWLLIAKTITSFTESKWILGMELDYVPRIFAGRRAALDGDTDDILGG